MGRKLKETIYSVVTHFVRQLTYRGLKVPVINPPVSRKIFQQLQRRDYEKPEIHAVLKLLREGDRVLELGSGLGIVSALASRGQRNVTVRSYEGNPDLGAYIRELHERNGITNVELRNEILLPDPTNPTIEFLTHRSFAESSIMNHGAVVKRVEVPCRDINAVFKEFRPNIFICDIEGGEEKLFAGIDLDGVRAVVIELHPFVISRAAMKRIYDSCAAAGLYPLVELSSATVVAFEHVSN